MMFFVLGTSVLQWGRNFIVAEINDTRNRPASTATGFNGAATLSLRKYKRACTSSPITTPLQWGRNFIVAEIFFCEFLSHAATVGFNGAATLSLRKYKMNFEAKGRKNTASMGPQLYRCGNQSGIRRHDPEPCKLQWGRNFIVAEM